ncbi:MAG: response regulator [Synergistaceae bacterium]|jgi:putative two-component system response regulator|nr:response regulator [Synergistaceae bacterium]
MSAQKSKVLIVDDTDINIDILVDALGDRYDLFTALDGESALAQVKTNFPDIILLDVVMPGMSGYEVCAELKSNPATADIPIIFLTAMTDINDKARGFELGAVDYMAKPFAVLEVRARLGVHLSLLDARKALKRQNETLEVKVRERTRELSMTQNVIIEAMASLAETRDQETGGHVRRTRLYVHLLAKRLASHPRFRDYLAPPERDELGKAATLHDIGKVGVPDNILLKPAKLTPGEFEEMKKHTIYGHNILRRLTRRLPNNSFLVLADEIAWSHHEKWNGQGYPRGLKGDEIPISGRLTAIADVYDALISARPYKKAMSGGEATDFIVSQSGIHFDPDVVSAFADLTDTFKFVASQLKDGALEEEDFEEAAADY